jgi:hypothetical protein
MKQTAVEFLEDYLKFKGIIIEKENYPQVIIGVINDAKEMEKQQVIDTYRDGRSDQQSERPSRFYNRNAEQYYNETFNK